ADPCSPQTDEDRPGGRLVSLRNDFYGRLRLAVVPGHRDADDSPVKSELTAGRGRAGRGVLRAARTRRCSQFGLLSIFKATARVCKSLSCASTSGPRLSAV